MPVRADQHDARHGATSPDSDQLSNRKSPTSLIQIPVASSEPHAPSRSTNPIVRPNASMFPRPGGWNPDLQVGMSFLKLHVRHGWAAQHRRSLHWAPWRGASGAPPQADGMRAEARAHLSDVSSLAMPHGKPGSGISRPGAGTGTGSICP
jgi:hypothetical protein